MLETIREFGLEQLAAAGEEKATRRAHAACFLAFAERAKPELTGPDPGPWLKRLEAEHDNFRSALSWSIGRGEAESETALRLGEALWLFWKLRGYVPEGRQWIERALAVAGDRVTIHRANALRVLGNFAFDDLTKARRFYEQSLELYEQLGDQRGQASALSNLGMTDEKLGASSSARVLQEQALALFQQMDDRPRIAHAYYQLGYLAAREENDTHAKEYLDEARSRWQQVGDLTGVAYALLELGRISARQGQLTVAEELLSWSLTTFRESRLADAEPWVLSELGAVALRRGDHAGAARAFRDALALFKALGVWYDYAVEAIEGFARLALLEGDETRAVKLWAACDAWRETTSTALSIVERNEREADLESARRVLGERDYEEAMATGHVMPIDEAAAFACTFDVKAKLAPEPTPAPVAFPFVSLTRQERRVLCYLPAGLSNKAIADEIGIKVRTVTTHVDHIFNKLGVDNRAAAAALAVRHGLCDSSPLSA
jgi:DNA-binding CsgD family transcriptional regulator/tetratricopeptide (TPR) repeat protein